MKNDRDIFRELGSLFFSTRQIIRSKLPDGGGDPNAWLRFETMQFIVSHSDPTMQELASYLRIRAPSATSLIAHLVGKGLVSRKVGKKDRRVKRLALTTAGTRALETYKTRSERILRAVFARFSEQDIRELARILARVRDLNG